MADGVKVALGIGTGIGILSFLGAIGLVRQLENAGRRIRSLERQQAAWDVERELLRRNAAAAASGRIGGLRARRMSFRR